MILAMFLAHLVGDYILQTNYIAAWKSRSLLGVTIHCLIVYAVTWLFALPFQPAWYVVPLIGIAHYLIDAGQFLAKPKLPALARFSLDQIAHAIVIVGTLLIAGYIDLSYLNQAVEQLMFNDQAMLYLVGYAFLTMPAWVMSKFAAYGLVKSAPPEFGGDDKYMGILERVLMVTFVLVGQYYLVPLVVAPRLMGNWQQVDARGNTAVYLTETLISVSAAVGVGLLLTLL